jgi:serine/threonine protein kinase
MHTSKKTLKNNAAPLDSISDIQEYKHAPMQTGGKFIGKGGFGCVVSPALKCSKKDKYTDMMVSKVIPTHDIHYSNELKISQVLKKIDPSKKYYLTFEKYCFINQIPDDRRDFVNVHYLNDELTKWEVVEGQPEKDKNACRLELALKPINLIMDYGGYSLTDIGAVSTKLQGTKAKMHQLFIDNLAANIKHLVLGLVKMHFNRIVNRDIKLRNIMMSFNKETKQVQLRYIDFGLSNLLTTEYCNDANNIRTAGTPNYIAPELYTASIVNRYRERSSTYQLQKIMRDLDANFKHSIMRINEREMLGNYRENIQSLHHKIHELQTTGKLLPAYFGTDKNKFNGYLQKADVYALGLAIFILLYVYSDYDVRGNTELYDLLIHMIAMDPDKRYNAVQCLSHPFLQSLSSKKKLII